MKRCSSTANHKHKALYERAVEVLAKLRSRGYTAYFAGGSVRDQIRGAAPTDYDIATSAKPDEVLSLFPQAIPVGASFGVVLIPVGRSCPEGEIEKVEVATFRSDGIYRDGRHPESVTFSDEREDALRRDFTINGMFFDPIDKRVIDYVGGQKDLDAGVIRSIGDPERRFAEDYLRIVRAIRFAAQFSFQIEAGTFAAIRRMAERIRFVSQERIRDEIGRIITGPDPARGLSLLEESGILGIILPEISTARGFPFLARVQKCFAFLPDRSLELALATLLCRVPDAVISERICARLKLSNAQTRHILSIVRDFSRFETLSQMGEAALKRFIRTDHFPELLALYRADRLAAGESTAGWEYCARRLSEAQPGDLFPPPLLSGDDLVRLGYRPGPGFKKVLSELETLQLEGKITTRERAEAWLASHGPEERPDQRKI